LWFAQFLGIVAGIITIIYAYRFSHKILQINAGYSLLPCLFLAVSGPFATWAASGMETTVFGMFLLIGCYHFARYWQTNYSKDLYFCSLALLLSALTRPEGLMCFAVLMALFWILSSAEFAKNFKAVTLPALMFLVPFAIYFLWRYSYFGYMLPNTFYAKTGGTLFQYLRGAIYTGYFFVYFVLPFLFLVVMLWWERTNSSTGIAIIPFTRSYLRTHHGPVVCISICAVYALYIILVGGDYMAMFRFFVPILPMIYILLGLATATLFSLISEFPRKKVVSRGLLAFGVIATIFQSTPLERYILQAPLFQHGQYQGVQTERWHSARLSLIGKFFHDYKHSTDESLATDAIGAIGYYSGMTVYDIYGIVDTHIAHLKSNRQHPGWGLPAHEKCDPAYTFSLKPTYYMFTRDFSAALLPYPMFETDNLSDYVQRTYKMSSVWISDGINGEEGYFCFLELKDRQR
jgi:arabinofuranosyltransferase